MSNLSSPSLDMSLNAVAARAYEAAKSKGFYDKPKSDIESIMLVVTELAEAVEEIRAGSPDLYVYEGETKPEGQAIEMTDALIRILDYMAAKNYNVEELVARKMAYNATRPYLHGKKV